MVACRGLCKTPPESQGSSPSLKNDDMHGTPTTRIVYPKALPWLAAGLLLFFIAILIGLWFDRYPALEARLFDENGVVETPELVALGISLLVFAYRAARSNDPVSAVCIVIAFLLINAMVRETPRCDSAVYGGGICFPTQMWKNVTVGLALVIAAVSLWPRRQHWRVTLSRQHLYRFWPMWVAFILLVAAEAAEHWGLLGTEETLELFAYLYVIAFGLWTNRHS